MPTAIFLSYRRQASDDADSLYAELVRRFGARYVFKDAERIVGGTDYEAALHQALEASDVMVAMVDPHWAVDRTGRNRLADPEDWVRREVEVAFRRSVPLLPVLVRGAHPPDAAVLPAEIARLEKIQAIPLREESWRSDVEKLFRLIDRVAIAKVGGQPETLIEGGSPLGGRRKGGALLLAPGTRVRIQRWAGTIKPEETGLPFEIVAAQGQTGTVLRIDGRIATVRWDAQVWSKRRMGFFKGATVPLDAFVTTINADWLEPLD